VTSARDRLAAALERLPEPEDYEPAARNLRELASVSPSLLAWLREEVPALSAPLADSVADLRQALLELERALELMDAEPEAEAPRVKVVVRGRPV
jgi:hypothetical protein